MKKQQSLKPAKTKNPNSRKSIQKKIPKPPQILAPEESVAVDTREKYMTLGEHFEELRQVLIKSLLVLGVLTSLLLFFSSDLHRILSDPYKRVLGEKAMFFPIKLMGPFMIYLQASFVVALIASLPIILYFFWGFIVPAVSHEIEKSGKLVIIVSSLLFWAGVALCWFRIFESILYFFLVYINPPDVRQELPLDEYYSIFFMIHLLFGLAFQLPIVVVILGRLGIVHSSFFISRWRESTMVVAVISVLIGPEIISSLILFGCLMVLFIGSVVFIRVAEKKEI